MKRNNLKCLAFYLSIGTAVQLHTGCHAGGGPLIGYAPHRSITLGWEAGGGFGPAHLNLGGSYRSGESQPEQRIVKSEGESDHAKTTGIDIPDTEAGIESVYYAALEPPFPISGTLGMGISTQTGLGFVGGVWFGWAEVEPWREPDNDLDCVDERPDNRIFFSGAFGIRYIVGVWEVYLTPKVGVVRCFEFGS